MTFVSNGRLVEQRSPLLPSTSLYPRTYLPLMSNSTGWAAYGTVYARQLWVYIMVNKLAKATARLPFVSYRRDELNRPRWDDHPMSQLLRAPNPAMSDLDLWLWTSSTYDIYGEAYWLKRRAAGAVVELYPLHPAGMVRDQATGAWAFRNGSLELPEISSSDLVIFKAYNPADMDRGLSPLEPLRATLENEWSARLATASFWARGARPGTLLQHPDRLSQQAINRLRDQFDAIHAGAERTGGTLVLEEGMKPERWTLTAEEAQYIETRKLNREEVCAAFDIPPPVVHILDRATFSNITEQMRSMYRDTMAPRLKIFEAAIETQLRRAEWPRDPVYAEFLMDEVLRGDFEARQDALAKASHMTIAEKRKVENLPFIEGTNRIFLNSATLPLDIIDSLAAAGQLPQQRRIDGRSVRAALGRLSWQGSAGDVDPDAVTDGIAPEAAGTIRALLASLPADTPIATVRSAIKASQEEQ